MRGSIPKIGYHTFRSTFVSRTGLITFKTASTAIGASIDDCWETTYKHKLSMKKRHCETETRISVRLSTFEFSDVEALLIKLSLSVSWRGTDMFTRISIALRAAFWNPSEIIVGWIPRWSSFSAASRRAPAITTTLVVPSPASISCAFDNSTNCQTKEKYYITDANSKFFLFRVGYVRMYRK